MIKIYCDKCNKEIDSNEPVGFVEFGSQRDIFQGRELETEYIDRNYCTDCMNELKRFLNIWVTKSEEPEEEETEEEEITEDEAEEIVMLSDGIERIAEESEKEDAEEAEKSSGKKRSERLDIGKIIALKNAGWKAKDIAGEMHCSVGAIHNAVYRHNLQNGGL